MLLPDLLKTIRWAAVLIRAEVVSEEEDDIARAQKWRKAAAVVRKSVEDAFARSRNWREV